MKVCLRQILFFGFFFGVFGGAAQNMSALYQKEEAKEELEIGEKFAIEANDLYAQFKYRESLSSAFLALENLKVQNNELLIAEVKNLIGNVYGLKSMYEQSTQFYLEATDLCKNFEESKNFARAIDMNIGLNYYELGDRQTAEHHYRMSITDFEGLWRNPIVKKSS